MLQAQRIVWLIVMSSDKSHVKNTCIESFVKSSGLGRGHKVLVLSLLSVFQWIFSIPSIERQGQFYTVQSHQTAECITVFTQKTNLFTTNSIIQQVQDIVSYVPKVLTSLCPLCSTINAAKHLSFCFLPLFVKLDPLYFATL